jgi:DHA1 family bicyclomycin/chloramphenicol resistance-like MFS transporter
LLAHWPEKLPLDLRILSKQKTPKTESTISKKQTLVYIFVLGFLLMVQTLVSDMFLPAYPNIAAFFKVPDAFVQYSLSAVTFGAAIGFFFAGPLSDSLGRKKPVLFALAIFTVASAALYVAPGIEAFVVLRFFQGLAGASISVVTQAIIRDLFVGNAMLKMLSRVWLVSGVAPMVSPFISAQLLLVAPDWRIIPAALAILGVSIFFLASKALVETHHQDKRRAKGFDGVNRRFLAVFKDRVLVGLVLIGMVQSVGLFSYLNIIPFLYQDSMGLTPVEFSIAFSITAFCWFMGIQAGSKLGRMFRATWVIFAALLLGVASGFGLFTISNQDPGIASVIPMMAMFMISFGMTITPIQTLALQGHGSEAGTAASVLGVMNSLTAALAAPLYPIIGSEKTGGLGLTILISHLVAIAIFFLVVRPRTVPALIKG